jgi:N-acetylneuraminic acid mutarotase
MNPDPLSPLRVRSHPAVRAALVLLSLAGAACSDDLPLPTAADPGLPMTTVPGVELAAETVPNSWTRRIRMPTARVGLVAATVNGIIYAIGGGGWNGAALQKVEAYNPNTNTLVAWTPRAPLPAVRHLPDGAAVINGKIYVPGGLTPLGPSRSLFVYNVASNSWTTKALMPIRSHGGGAAAIDGKLWVLATPEDEDGFYTNPTRLFRYDPATDTWSEREPAPHHHHRAVVRAINGKLYVAGGMTNTLRNEVTYQYEPEPWAELDVYDPATNVWTTKASMPTARWAAAGGVIDGKLYVAGGTGTDFSTLSAMEVYDPATNTWAARAKMLTPRAGTGAAVAGGVFHVLGGTSGPDSDALRTNEAYTK